ncbi:MAG: hypothetical protein ABEI86_04920 [Halobacteriaceae archaeon]
MALDPAFVGLLLLLVGFFFFVYLFIRRTVLSFREGINKGKNNR